MKTFEDCIFGFEQYLYIEKNYSHKTISTYKSNLYGFAKYLHIGKTTVKISDITNLDINNYIIYHKTKLKNKPSTINLLISTLKSFYRYLQDKNIICLSSNITCDLKQQKLPKKLPLFLTYEEAEHLLLGTKLLSNNTLRDYALICLFLLTGARLSEVASLTLEQINFADKSITFWGKGAKERTVPMIERAELAIKEYINQIRVMDMLMALIFLITQVQATI